MFAEILGDVHSNVPYNVPCNVPYNVPSDVPWNVLTMFPGMFARSCAQAGWREGGLAQDDGEEVGAKRCGPNLQIVGKNYDWAV